VTMAERVDPAALSRTLQALASDVGEREDLETSLQSIIEASLGVFDVSGAGLMFVDESQVLRYAAASDARSAVLEAAQERFGAGPCVDALLFDTLVSTVDLANDSRWPALGSTVVPQGVVAVLGIPVHVGGTAVGSLNLYSEHPREWDQSEIDAMAAFVQLIERLLGTAVLAHRSGALVAQLEYALEHRVVIERAVGLIMGRSGVDAVAAFNELRAQARAQRRKVAGVAQQLLDQHAGRAPSPDSD
jgi:GAF domain-containing protein